MPTTTTPAPPPAADRPVQEVESELLGLAGNIAAAQCRFLVLLAEYDRRGGWAGPGLRSCAHWLSWRIGMSLRTAGEHVRVARALAGLPEVTAAFAAGRISYSKVRAITRAVGDLAGRDRLLERAADRLDGLDPDDPDDRPGPTAPALRDPQRGDGTGPRPRSAPADGGGGDDAGDGDAGGENAGGGGVRLRPAPGCGVPGAGSAPGPRSAERVAVRAGGAPGAPDRTRYGDPSGTGPTDAVPGARPADGTGAGRPVSASAVGRGTAEQRERALLELALTGTASHVETVVRAVRRRTVGPSDAVARRSLSWRWADDGSLVVRGRLAPAEGAALIAAVEARLSPGTAPVDDLVRGERQDGDEPGRTAPDVLAARRADALVDVVTAAPASDGEVVRGGATVTVVVDVAEGGARIADGPEVPAATAERLACDARARALLRDRTGNRLYLGRSRRLASPAQIAALTVRDGGACRFPGCAHRRHLHAHHVRSWLRGGATDLDNLVLLCRFHHRLVHELGYGVHRGAGGSWWFTRPDGRPVPRSGAPLDGSAERLVEEVARTGTPIARDGLTPTWWGERLDPAPLLDHLLPHPAAARRDGVVGRTPASSGRAPARRAEHRRRGGRPSVASPGAGRRAEHPPHPGPG